MDCAPESFSSYLSVCVCARERDHLSSPAKSAFKPALSLSSSCVFPNAATFCVFRAGSAKGSCRRTSCSRNFRARPFFFFRREAAEVMTKLRFEDVEGMAPLHRAGPRAVLKGSGSGALPDPAEAVREVTASPPPSFPFLSLTFPSPPRGPHPSTGCHGAEGAAFLLLTCRPVRRRLVSSPSCKEQWKDVSRFPCGHVSPRGHGIWRDVPFLSLCLLPSPLLPRGLQLHVGLQNWLIRVCPPQDCSCPPLLVQLAISSSSGPVRIETDIRNSVRWKRTGYVSCSPQRGKEKWSKNIWPHFWMKQ